MKSDIEIAHEVKMKPVTEIAGKLGIDADDLVLYGKYKAKVPLKYIDKNKYQKNKLVLVSAISPTPAGEGKTTVSIGLAQALNRLGKQTTVVLREPSLGPVFGVKGGATGGGYSQVLPMEDINLHFTGDFAAIERAHNLLAALIDNNIQSKKRSLGIDPRTVRWKRIMDMNDRSLRHIIVGLGGTSHGVPRETGFDITAASEVMAILCLAENIDDLKKRLGNIFIGFTYDKKPIYARDLNAQGAMAALLRDAIMPNLVQTIEGTPAIIHGGPFANIAQGTNSVLATKLGLSLSDFVVTEAGFGFDLGAEKFIDIKCEYAGLNPNTVVLVATVRALKYHGNKPLKEVSQPDLEALKRGIGNLQKHVENMKQFGICPVVAINRFTSDTDEEVEYIKQVCRDMSVQVAAVDVWGKGGEGAIELAEIVNKIASSCSAQHKTLYDWSWTPELKIETLAKRIYGAEAVDYTPQAKADLEKVYSLGLDKLPICVAKTQKSLSDNPDLLGRPKDFVVTVREIEVASGAGFIIPITGQIMRMPGLPDEPAAERMDVDNNGVITGLF
ncbi:MAG: formate--tetrahydrofolate ligase [Bacteroidales bacterium]|jgi:formate--tetrahydrofolate ligase|nr:formate--tetrahydrofolate ligase [Bacteroidales bacterium]HOA09400.1 formate--tetrahydrofolate ligase [Tenuifilaceae bacterium]MBP8643620.1 formate--tetrahydrofolate ligase [Bacteroidales bacterium]HOC36198.1 formate--tetrahydrofolate ligase [Tenuifilaceae bacterium]HOG72024.1 formate--tetrahydrofolate ligase [Tenuifilaceae bacterium]